MIKRQTFPVFSDQSKLMSIPPLLSFIIMARNDEYMGNSTWRLETTINYIAKSLYELGRNQDAEIIIVDWLSNIPLHTMLGLDKKAVQMTRFIIVPPEFSREVKFENDFPRPVIINVGVRRARGKYIVQTLGDVLWTKKTLSVLFGILDGDRQSSNSIEKALFVFGRKEIPFDVTCNNPRLLDLDNYINDRSNDLPYEIVPYLMVPADSLMMHRDLWLQSHGFDEALQHWGWSDCDLILRMRLKYKVFTIEDEKELFVYHLNHISNQNKAQVESRKTNPIVFNPFVVNGPDWGLANHQFVEFPEQPCQISFSLYNNDKLHSEIGERYRRKHIINLINYFLKNMSVSSMRTMSYYLFIMLSQYPNGSLTKRLYLLINWFNKNRKKINAAK